MSKREQALRIEPKNEIHFKGPYNRVVTEYFHLANPTDKPIAFKVKTTAPKRYCVRPNNGTIAPGKSVNVAVMLQPLTSGEQVAPAAALEKNKHKFMIQSVFAATEGGNADDLFKSVGPDDIMDSKFRCVFDDTAAANATNAAPNSSATGGPVGSGRPESDGEDKDMAETVSTGAKTARGQMVQNENAIIADDVASSTTVFSAPTAAHNFASADSSHMTNGADEDSQATARSVYSTAINTSSGDSGEVKRLLDENRDLRVKLQEFERVSKSSGGGGGAGPYNRFGGATASATSPSSTSSLSQQQKSPATSSTSNLLDQPLSGQVILTVLISLLIGFILGKVDLGLF